MEKQRHHDIATHCAHVDLYQACVRQEDALSCNELAKKLRLMPAVDIRQSWATPFTYSAHVHARIEQRGNGLWLRHTARVAIPARNQTSRTHGEANNEQKDGCNAV